MSPFSCATLYYLMPAIPSKNIRKRIERTRPPQAKRNLSLSEFYRKRNKVIVIRGVGGLGDCLMHRMMFEDFKLLAPDVEIHFACPQIYHDAVSDHPFIDRVLSVEDYNRQEYLASYITTTACGRYEMKQAPFSGMHRSDIWAQHCGVLLTKHNMHIKLTEEEKQEGRKLIEENRDRPGPSVMISPISAMHNKDLLDRQIMGLTKGLHERGYYVFGLHTKPIYPFLQNDIPTISGVKLRQWLGIIDQTDYTISVDSAAFHAAGGMGKPLVGIFTFVNSETYSRYFSTVEIVQGKCPKGYSGCYNWGTCPYSENGFIPCNSSINCEEILNSFDKLVKRFPT